MKSSRVRFILVSLTLLALGSILLVACQRPGTSTASASSNSTAASSTSTAATVHMGDANFLQSSVTLSKGSTLTLIDDAAVPHIVQNGSWVNGSAQPAAETGAPTVNVQFQGNDSQSVGPFNTAGTFHLYCTIHPNMNLTVVVQ